MHLVSVSEIGGEDGAAKVCYTLVAEITAGIVVVQVEAKAESFVGVHCELGVDTVFAVLLVTAVVVGDTGVGREGVHKEEFIRLLKEETIGVRGG